VGAEFFFGHGDKLHFGYQIPQGLVLGHKAARPGGSIFDEGALEVHMRPSCPTLVFPCEYLNFSASRSTLDLVGRSVILELEGADDKYLDEYATAGSEKNLAMIEIIRQRLQLTSLRYQHLDDLVRAGPGSVNLHRHWRRSHHWQSVY